MYEAKRLQVLREHDILDTPPEPAFDRIVLAAQEVCQVPIALITLVDEYRQWFKAAVGLEICETDRAISFCTHAIQQSEIYIVADAQAHTQFATNPLVLSYPYIRFYAGVPLITQDGYALGTLCVIDSQPRCLTVTQQQILQALAQQVAIELQRRRAIAQLTHPQQDATHPNPADVPQDNRMRSPELKPSTAAFISVVSHDIRVPLSIILTSTDLLQHHDLQIPPERKPLYFQRIRQAVQRIEDLLEDLVVISQSELGALHYRPAPLSLDDFCHNLVQEVQLSSNYRCAIELEESINLPSVIMDAKLLRHIFTNLLSNAVKYSLPGGAVYFEVQCQGGQAIFRVRDEGIGIPANDFPQLYTPFYRGQNVGTIPGTGLGLAIVKICIGLHGGQIEVDSEVGQGTTVTVTLPLGLSSSIG